MSDQAGDDSAEGIAFREAGHAVMAYLIVKAGIADSSFAAPISQGDRELLVPQFKAVAADGALSDLMQPRSSLRNLITVPLFVFAGFAAQRIHRDPSSEPVAGKSRAEGLARGMMHGYWEEFGGDASGAGSKLQQFIDDWNEFAHETIRDHWKSVSALAERLLEERELSREEAFEVIERHLAGKGG